MRSMAAIAIALVLAGVNAPALETTNAAITTATTNIASTELSVTDEKAWSFSVSVSGYFVPDGRDYAQPTITADYDWLHLEARYNSEALETGSVWIGYNFSVGDKLSLDFTPMLGGVFGDLTGIAPGYEFTLSYWKLELYSNGEYVFDTRDTSGNYFYTWSELSLAPVDWFRFGLVVQRTKVYQTDLEFQRGLLVGGSYKRWDFTAYLFNPAQDAPTVVLTLDFSF